MWNQRDDEVILTMEHVSFRYMPGSPFEQLALDDIDFSLKRGERVALVGQTGSGKSTLAGLCNGIAKPTGGVVRVFGLDTRGDKRVQRQLRARVGHVMQSPEDQLFEHFVGDDVAFGSLKLGFALAEARERAKRAMALVGLDFAEKDLPIYSLSRGKKRLVAIAGILAMEPDLLILDEPTSGLDPLTGRALLASLSALNQTQGTTLLFITHRVGEVLQLASRVVVMERGRVIRDGDPEALFFTAGDLPRGLHIPEEALIGQHLRQSGVDVSRGDLTATGLAQAMLRGLRQEERQNG